MATPIPLALSFSASAPPSSKSLTAGTFNVRPATCGEVAIDFRNFTGTLLVRLIDSPAAAAVSTTPGGPPSAVSTVVLFSPVGAPPPGASPLPLPPAAAADVVSSSSWELPDAQLPPTSAGIDAAFGVGGALPALDPVYAAAPRADVITAGWSAPDADDAVVLPDSGAGAVVRPAQKRARHAAGSGEDAIGGVSRRARADAPAPTPVSADTVSSAFSHLVVASGTGDDTLALVGASWIPLSNSALGAYAPSPRWGHAAAIVDDSRVVLYGGQDATDAVRGDTWSLDISNDSVSARDAWSCRIQDQATSAVGGAAGASPRMWAALVPVPERNLLVTIGKVDGPASSSSNELEIDVFDTSIDLWCDCRPRALMIRKRNIEFPFANPMHPARPPFLVQVPARGKRKASFSKVGRGCCACPPRRPPRLDRSNSAHA